MKKIALMLSLAGVAFTAGAQETPTVEQMWEIIQQQQKTIEKLEAKLADQESDIKQTTSQVEQQQQAITVVSDAVEQTAEPKDKVHIGGYGELHYNNLDSGNEFDFHRFVLFFGYDFNEKTRFFSELEIEHSLAGDGKPGEVELEQAYIEHLFSDKTKGFAGLRLIPVGILNEVHEPNTFFGVERNAVEKNIIPTTWWEAGVGMNHEFNQQFGIDVFAHSGLKTPTSGSKAFLIRSGRQKVAEADGEDLAYTARLRYQPMPGLQLAATYQHQVDITQGAMDVAADLYEINGQFQRGGFGLRALYAKWNLDDNVNAVNAARAEQEGYYIEPSFRFGDNRQYGVFARYSSYNNNAADENSLDHKQMDVGMNYWLTPQVVFKIDYQDQSDGGDDDGFNLGVGYSF